MLKQPSARLLAVVLALAVGLLGIHASLHWDGHSYDNCQACHTGRVAISQPTVQLSLQPPVPVARFAPPETVLADLEPVCTHRIPRSPPA
jgi:hypothetical protein